MYNPERHEPLTKARWSASVVGETIDRIVANARGAMSPSGQFSAHRRDNSDAEWSGTSETVNADLAMAFKLNNDHNVRDIAARHKGRNDRRFRYQANIQGEPIKKLTISLDARCHKY